MKKLLVMFFAASMFAACGDATPEAAEDNNDGGDTTSEATADPVETENNDSDTTNVNVSDSLK